VSIDKCFLQRLSYSIDILQIYQKEGFFMASSRVKDMTSGSPGKLLLAFALPVLGSNLLQNVYNLVDATLAGHLYGASALAAIGATASIYGLLISLASGMNGGFEIVLARAFGSHDEEKFRRAIVTMLVLNLAVSGTIALLSCLLIRPILHLMNTPEDIFPQASRYILIILAGMPITAMYNMESSLMRSLGNSRTPLLFLIVSTLANVLLDLLFVLAFDWGVTGIALATILAQLTSAVLCFFYILRFYPELHFRREHTKPEKALYTEMFATGVSMALMSSIFSIGSVCVQSAINSFGTLTIGAYTAARKVTEFLNMPGISLARSLTVFVSQNYGAGKIERCKKACRLNMCYAIVLSICMILIVLLFGAPLHRLISGSDDPELTRLGVLYMRIEVGGFPVLNILQSIRMFMQGVGRKIVPIISSTIELIGKLLFTWIFIPMLGFLGVCISEPILWVACTIFLIFSYIHVTRQLQEGASTI